MVIPLTLTIIFVIVGLLLSVVLAWAAWRHRNPPTAIDDNLPNEVKDFGPSETNRWIRGLRFFFILLIVTVVAFHYYWVFRADSNETFASARLLDRRNIRVAESGLKGWVLDRTGDLARALVRYKYENGLVLREYPLGEAAVHLTGYSDALLAGMEAAYRDWLSKSASTYNLLASPIPVGKDLQTTVDVELQREAFNLIQATGKQSAAVVLLLPNNEVLAMASFPSFKPEAANDEATWRKLTDQAEDPLGQHFSPLVNRALGTLVTGGASFYYHPGSTFKVFVAAVAIDTGVTKEIFNCKAEGFTPPNANRAINDFANEVHGNIGLADAVRVSCNQYFAQLGLKLGKEKLAAYGSKMLFATQPDEGIKRALELWLAPSAEMRRFNYIFAPPLAKMNLSAKATPYQVALQAFGQGEGDLTLMQMAMIAATAASGDGAFVAPTFELGAERKIISPFISADSARQLRQMMRGVVEGGTASGAFAPLAGRVTAGGKTGTADQPISVVDYVDKQGKTHYRGDEWTNSWFIGFAPADNPQIAFAVLVENGGEGSKAAAPIAVKLIDKAIQLGYIKGAGAPSRQQPAPPAR
jgi:cell division protein FtsI/penicillin-binding protein 2